MAGDDSFLARGRSLRKSQCSAAAPSRSQSSHSRPCLPDTTAGCNRLEPTVEDAHTAIPDRFPSYSSNCVLQGALDSIAVLYIIPANGCSKCAKPGTSSISFTVYTVPRNLTAVLAGMSLCCLT
mmetsp:Transcript_82865/g.115112  ORF Transcript_82865/g.115112 Transcript_82865/m.115112 type:complete len:124 (-) Transcript_82865:222-593(-)